MNKKAFVNEILDLYDTIEGLKNKLAKYENPTQVIACGFEETKKNKTIKELNNKAKDLLFERVINKWQLDYYCKVEVKEDDGEFNFLTFEQWFKSIKINDVINSDYYILLDTLTFEDVRNYFIKQFENYHKQLVDKKKMEIVRAKKDE